MPAVLTALHWLRLGYAPPSARRFRCALILAAGLGLAAGAPKDGPQDPNYKAAAAQKAGAEERRSAPVLAIKDHSGEPNASSEADEGDPKKQSNEYLSKAVAISAIVQGVVSIFGLIGLIFTVLFAAGAWRAAKRSADAAHSMLLQDAKRTVHELRAYVFPVAAEIAHPIVPDTRVPTIKVTFENSGQTPAYGVRTSVAVIFTNPGYEPEGYADEDVVSAVPPGGKCTKEIRSRHVLGEYEVNAITSGAVDVMLFGYVKYSSFGEEWISHFRYRYDGSDGKPAMVACPPGDHAAEETQD